MLLIKYIILSIIQGFTEPLPISSSGHLKLFKTILNSDVLNDLNFEIIVNFGSLIGIIYLYRKEILNIIKDFFKYIKTKEMRYYPNFKYVFLIIISTIPACIVGIFIKKFIEEYFTIRFVGLAFIFTSIMLYSIKDINGNKSKKDITYIDAFKIGLYQVLALIPGISRSASTITGSLKNNLSKEESINYSFMMYIPISIATSILGISDLINSPKINALLIPYIVSILVSMIVTFYSTKLFINIVKKGKLIYFSVYCFILGFLIFIIY